jgi:hypothetical protein
MVQRLLGSIYEIGQIIGSSLGLVQGKRFVQFVNPQGIIEKHYGKTSLTSDERVGAKERICKGPEQSHLWQVPLIIQVCIQTQQS